MDSKVSNLEQLIAGCKKKDTWARKRLYELFAPAMQGVCVRYVNDKETARDILQEGFIKVYTKINSYSGLGSFEGWMRRVFVTTALEYLRNTKNIRHQMDIEDYREVTDNFQVSVLDQISADEIVQCIQELPTGFRTVFNLYAVEGYSHAEIAEMLNVKEASSRSQYARARQILQSKILNLYSK
jgi:RNA polymerase sigma factor, sigma-70 family